MPKEHGNKKHLTKRDRLNAAGSFHTYARKLTAMLGSGHARRLGVYDELHVADHALRNAAQTIYSILEGNTK